MNSSIPTTVFVFKSNSAYEPFKPQYRGKTKSNVAGYFLSRPEGNYITLTTDRELGDPYHIIFHEYFHFLVGNNLRRAPVWLNEGLAEFYSTFETRENDKKVRIGSPIIYHLQALNVYPLLPLKTLLEVKPSSTHYNDSFLAGIFYAESWALVHYLMFGNKARQGQLIQFISRLNSGLSLEENFRQSFQTDYNKLQRELDLYVQRRAYPVAEAAFVNPADLDESIKVSQLTDADVQYYLGDLWLQLGRFEDAEARLQKALDLQPGLASAQISLARIRIWQKRLPEAKKLLESAMTLDPHNYLVPFYYAEELSEEGQDREAVRFYNQALALKSDIASVHAGLGFTYVGLDEGKKAANEFALALAIDRRNDAYYHSRSFTYLRLRRGSLAATAARFALELGGWHDEAALYMVLTLYFGERLAHNKEVATATLKEEQSRIDKGLWPYPVVQYLLDEISVQDLLKRATDNDKQTEVHAYLGLNFSLAEKREEALEQLRWVKEHGNKDFFEYRVALAELERLEKGEAK
ncbi:MAG TPA: hypothetical protein DC047_11990 [Blastocatellia bacterium]|nr:hypothetical protein [Blastocatellia bacterium]